MVVWVSSLGSRRVRNDSGGLAKCWHRTEAHWGCLGWVGENKFGKFGW